MLTEYVYATHSVLSVPNNHSGAQPGLSRNLVVVTDWSDIDLLADPAKNILLSPWAPSTSLRTTIAATRFDALLRLGLTLPKERIAQASDFARDEPSRQLLTELAPALAALASIAPGRKLRLSLCKTKEQSCPLFHTDRVPVRLLCTLRGPGTEWLDDAQVNRKALGRGDNRKIAGPEATVYAAQPFQIVRLKGDAEFGGNAPCIVHRSPAVPASMDGRWYLLVDRSPPTDWGFIVWRGQENSSERSPQRSPDRDSTVDVDHRLLRLLGRASLQRKARADAWSSRSAQPS